MGETKLKPCPFCGGEVSIALKGDKTTKWFVTRGFGENKCTCRVFMESELMPRDASKWTRDTVKKELADKWNTRKPMDNIVAELEEEHKKAFGKYREAFELYKEEFWRGRMSGLTSAIEIVRKGGVE